VITMTTLDRRTLLSRAVLGGTATLVGATAMGSLAPETAFATADQLPEPGAPDPNFAEGRISGRNDNLLLVTGSDGVFRRIRITGGTSIWKLRPTTADQVAVGDGLYARGVPMPDGTFAAESMWVNIVNLTVQVTAIGRNALTLDHHGQRITAHVVPGTSAAVYNGAPAVSDLTRVRVGRHAQVLGAWRPGTDEIDIATVYAAA
jgi:hypothetical protein